MNSNSKSDDHVSAYKLLIPFFNLKVNLFLSLVIRRDSTYVSRLCQSIVTVSQVNLGLLINLHFEIQ